MGKQDLPPNNKIWQLVLGYANTFVIYALVKSGVTEQLRDSQKTIEELSTACKLNQNVLFRVLRFAAAIDLVELKSGHYSLTETGKFLLKDVPGTLYNGVMVFGSEPWQRSWNNLLYSLKSGKSSFENVNGIPLFDFLNRHPEEGKLFNNLMTANSILISKLVPEVYDFSIYKTICDIGGGQGFLLKDILAANPGLYGILYDHENVVRDHLLGEMADRVEIISGNFFESVPSADVLIMKNIIHDWDDDKALQILNCCKKVMTANTKLLLIGRILDNSSDLVELFFDLHMQVMLNGKERTADEFSVLLNKAGLKLNRVIPVKSPMKIIEVIVQ